MAFYTLKFPFNIFYQPANAIYISIILIMLLVKQNHEKKYFLLLAPALANSLPLFLINLAQDLRYVYINYLTLIFVLLIFVNNYNFKNKKTI